jgi:hypothetical protein
MAQYNPFAERAGMKLILKREPDPSIVKAIEALRGLGFNPSLMASKSYNIRLLSEFTIDQVDQVREILLAVASQYYKRLMSSGKPYIRKGEFGEWIYEQPPERLARCLAILGVLNEAKAYLYWCRDWLSADIRKNSEVET